MRAYFMFTASGPMVILTSYDCVTSPELLRRLESKGVDKFVASEIPIELAREKYGVHFDMVCQDLHETDDLRVLDYNGQRTFRKFSFSELEVPVYHEREPDAVALADIA